MHKRLAIGLLAAIVVVGLVVARRHELLRFTIERGASLGSGYAVRIDRMHVGWGAAAFWGVRMRRDGLPVLDADYVALHYSLRDLLPGSTHRFGLLGAELSGARVTLTRFRDGTFNLSLPQSGPAVPLPERTNPVPLHFSLRVRGLQLELREPAAFEESAKTVRVRDVSADGVVNTAGVTTYRVDGAFAARRPEPFAIRGKIDAIAGYAMHRARAPFFPLRALANYFADTPVVRVLKGAARNFDARIYALDVEPDVAPQYHVSLRLDVEGARIALEPLAQPVDGIHGRLEVIDNAFFVRGVRATLAGMPMRIDGGVYDFSGALTGKAQLRLGISAAGDLAIFRNAFTFTKDQPIAGRTSLGVLVEGPIDDPLIVAKANAPRARYRTLPFDALDANVIYHSGLIAFAPLGASYGGVGVRIRGSLTLGKHLRSQLALHVAAPAGRLPYLDEMLGQEPIVVDAAALGSDLLFHVVGTAASARDESRLAALFEFGSERNGERLAVLVSHRARRFRRRIPAGPSREHERILDFLARLAHERAAIAGVSGPGAAANAAGCRARGGDDACWGRIGLARRRRRIGLSSADEHRRHCVRHARRRVCRNPERRRDKSDERFGTLGKLCR